MTRWNAVQAEGESRQASASQAWRDAVRSPARRIVAATIARVRFPVVLFDLDGTVVDSGGIILASMRHATRTVLRRDISDEELMAAVGGPALEAQMRAFGPDRGDAVVRVSREHNAPPPGELEGCA